MASYEGKIVSQLLKHTECSICLTAFTDPRVVPCLHTFCLKCLENTASSTNKRPGDEMPCPGCLTIFTVPANGFAGLMTDFKMNSLQELADYMRLISSYKEQSLHLMKELDEKRKRFLKEIDEKGDAMLKRSKENINRIESDKNSLLEVLSSMKEFGEGKKRYLEEIDEKEDAILKRSKKDIDRIISDRNSLLEELSSMKDQHLSKMEEKREELQRQCVMIEKFQTYYEAKVTDDASLADICRVKDELPIMPEALWPLGEWFKTNKVFSFEVLLQLRDKIDIYLLSEINNVVGRINGATKELASVIIGSWDDMHLSDEMFDFDLCRAIEIFKMKPVPTKLQRGAVAVSFEDKLFVIGIGRDYNEIWKFERNSGWKKCTDLDQSRYGHCANVVDSLVYICGGWNPLFIKAIKSVKAYDLQTDKCSAVGELVNAVYLSASVVYKGLIYIFGGEFEHNREVNFVQIFNTRDNTCSLFSKPLPSPQIYLRALIWNHAVILLNRRTCFTFDFETENWREMKQFKTGVDYFGLVHDEEKVYIFGGSNTDGYSNRWSSTDVIKCVLLDDIIKGNMVEWKEHRRLAKPTRIHAYT